MENVEIYKKILAAKQHISMTDMKKEGWNDYSNYKYFTPDQINKLVFLACQEANLLTLFDLKRNEFGTYGELTIIDLDSFEKVTVHISTAIPEMKASNAAQQLGACVTYTERYLKMTTFGISDNSLDPDTSENTQKTNSTDETVEKKWLNKNTKDWDNVIVKLKSKEIDMKKVLSVYKMRKEAKEELLKLVK